MYGCCFFGVGCCPAGAILRNCMASAFLEFAAAPLEASVSLATASPLEASATQVWLLFLWSLLLFIWLHVPLEVSSIIVWLLLLWSPLLYRWLLPARFLHKCVAAAPLKSAALQGAARWRLPLLSGCCSSGVRCSIERRGCSARGVLHNCVAAAPLESAALHEAAPLMTVVKQGNFFGFFPMNCIQHCFICLPSDSTASEDAGIEPRTVATSALTIRRSSHTRLGLIHTRLDLIHSRLDLIYTRLDLIHKVVVGQLRANASLVLAWLCCISANKEEALSGWIPCFFRRCHDMWSA